MATETTTDKSLDVNSRRHQSGMEPLTSLADPGMEVHSYPAQAYTQTGDIHRQQQLQQQWVHPQSASLKPEETNAPSIPDDRHRRILGLKAPVFWCLLVILVIIVAGGIGGGVGAGLATQGHNRDNNSNSNSSNNNGSNTATPTSKTVGAAATLLPLWEPDLTPRDDGCPKIDTQNYTPRDPAANNGTGITLQGQSEAQTFQQLCNTNYSDFNGTNPGMRDLLSVFTKTFDECMTLCAQYNRQYQQHQIDEKADIKPEGYCRAVSMNKYRKLDQDPPSD
ncbi:hypothetical protein PG988_006071 [Apiospora saccharicola]